MSEKRFEEVYKQGVMGGLRILRDNETGVQYLLLQEGYGAGLTVLVDQDGKPLLDPAFKK